MGEVKRWPVDLPAGPIFHPDRANRSRVVPKEAPIELRPVKRWPVDLPSGPLFHSDKVQRSRGMGAKEALHWAAQITTEEATLLRTPTDKKERDRRARRKKHSHRHRRDPRIGEASVPTDLRDLCEHWPLDDRCLTIMRGPSVRGPMGASRSVPDLRFHRTLVPAHWEPSRGAVVMFRPEFLHRQAAPPLRPHQRSLANALLPPAGLDSVAIAVKRLGNPSLYAASPLSGSGASIVKSGDRSPCDSVT